MAAGIFPVKATRRTHAPQPVQEGGQPAAPDEAWMTYLCEVCALLWPPPATVTAGGWPARLGASWTRGGNGAVHAHGSRFTLLRWPSRSQLLVPAEPRAAAAAVRHYGVPGSRAARLGARAMSFALATGLGGSALSGGVQVIAPRGADTIEAHLKATISPDLQVSMYLGAAHANRKPVLQLLSAAGRPVGFAKIGINPLTRDLVRAEHGSLTRLGRARLGEITVPSVLYFGQWHGLEVLVLSALPVWLRRRPLPEERLAAAMAEVARIGGVRSAPLNGSAYLPQLRSRLAAADESPARAALMEQLGALTERAGGTVLSYGAWHGDFTPWNMASTDSGLLVWDWERFTLGVPLGFDLLHHWLQSQVGPGRREPLASATGCAERAPQLLARLGIRPAEARLTAVLYLADLATRYLVDRQAKAGAPRGAPGTWLTPAIAREVERL